MKQLTIFILLLFCCSIAGLADNNKKLPPPAYYPESGQNSGQQIANVSVDAENITVCFNTSYRNAILTITDEWGAPVYELQSTVVKGQSITVNTNGWSNGIYYVMISDSEGNIIQQEAFEHY